MLAGLPEPEPQVWVTTTVGRFRVDLLDHDNRVVTEADGRQKYAEVSDLWAGKRREDALRETGLEVVRFVMADLSRSERWLAAYRRAVSRGRRRSPMPRRLT
jgi:very-short-patch-repair endonuclease